eukprot:7443839-Pyramimonas_sp.AAC.1
MGWCHIINMAKSTRSKCGGHQLYGATLPLKISTLPPMFSRMPEKVDQSGGLSVKPLVRHYTTANLDSPPQMFADTQTYRMDWRCRTASLVRRLSSR